MAIVGSLGEGGDRKCPGISGMAHFLWLLWSPGKRKLRHLRLPGVGGPLLNAGPCIRVDFMNWKGNHPRMSCAGPATDGINAYE